jgi:hypothetical protein
LKLLHCDASYQRKGLEQIFSDLLKTNEEKLSTDDITNICRRLEDTKFSKKRDAKFESDGIKPKAPIDSTEDTVVRKMSTGYPFVCSTIRIRHMERRCRCCVFSRVYRDFPF